MAVGCGGKELAGVASPRTVIIVACEHSADNYGALLARELKAREPGITLIGLGGGKMAAAGVELIENTVDHAATGLVEILGELKFFLGAMRKLEAAARERRADVAVLIDSPEFNLRAAPRLKAAGVKVAYYVSPQLWVWRSGRVTQVQRYVDEMMVIFPFEKTWYEERGVDVSFVGHPMLDLMDIPAIRARAAVLRDSITPEGRTLVGILPGSRRNEIRQLLPRLLETARRIRAARPDIVFAIGCPPRLTDDQLTDYLRPYMDMNIRPLHGQTHELMAASDYLLACSGTAMLEAGLLGTPMLGTYRFGWVTYFLLRLFMFRDSEQLFTLPNIVLGRRVVREMLQFQSDPVTLALAALDDLHNRLPELREELAKIEGLLGGPGASGRAAERVLGMARQGG